MNALSGARPAMPGGLRGLLARAMAADLRAFVVPGLDIARAGGLDPAGAGLRLADTPRHADVLLIAGPLPPDLLDAACVVWAQMPRPRAILALGADNIAPLPAPDAVGALSQDGLAEGVATLRKAFATGAFARNVTDFDAPALAARIEYTCPMHPEVISDEPGKCPICGMFLVEREVSGAAPASDDDHKDHHGQGAHKHGKSTPTQAAQSDHSPHAAHGDTPVYTCPMHPEVTSDSPGSCPKCGMDLVPQDKEDAQSGHHGHGDHSP
ncbi:heavy metal-binding domain-containing protein, partial [Allgaiera indica]